MILLASAAMFTFSWLKWADALIDFGVELYLPWRLVEGDVLYRDLAHYYSPLSVLVNAGWFRVFGVSYLSLVIGNTVVLAATLVIIYQLLRKMASLLATTTAIVVMVTVFAFGQYVGVGNYNYISPYSHELTHGLLLGLLAITALGRYFEGASRSALIGSAVLVGVVFLTKYELFAATFGGVVVALIAHHRSTGRAWKDFARDVLCFASVMLAPPAICWALLSAQVSTGAAFRAVLGPYPFMFHLDAATSRFLWEHAGLAAPGAALSGVLAWTLYYALATVPAAFLGRSEHRLERKFYVLALILPAVVLGLAHSSLEWSRALSPLPFFLLASMLGAVMPRGSALGRDGHADPVRVAIITFALLLLAKMPLTAGVSHYGFVLAMPGTLLLVVSAIDDAPAWLDAHGLSGPLFRTAVFGILVLAVGVHLLIASRFYSGRSYTLAEGPDALRVDARRGAAIARAVQAIREVVGKDQTLVVLPEGAMVNYLARRKSSVSHLVFHPTPLAMYGEDNLLSELRAHPPDYVLLFSSEVRNLSEFGCPVFGEDCAQKIGAWLKKRYAPRVTAASGGRRLFTLLGRNPSPAPDRSPEAGNGSAPR